jgi:hypothetical protein
MVAVRKWRWKVESGQISTASVANLEPPTFHRERVYRAPM